MWRVGKDERERKGRKEADRRRMERLRQCGVERELNKNED